MIEISYSTLCIICAVCTVAGGAAATLGFYFGLKRLLGRKRDE